jgi:hypothetical protein
VVRLQIILALEDELGAKYYFYSILTPEIRHPVAISTVELPEYENYYRDRRL